MTLKPPTDEKHSGPLKRSLRKAISKEEPDYELMELMLRSGSWQFSLDSQKCGFDARF